MKMNLKNKKKTFIYKKRIFIIIIILSLLIGAHQLIKNISYYYLNYSEKEVIKIIDTASGKGITDKILNEIKDKELYTVSKNSFGEIEMIDYNSYLVNLFLRDVSKNISDSLDEQENSKKIAFYVPLGSIFQNPILNNKGPKIPVRMEIIGSVFSNMNIKIKEYGINNCLIEMYVHIEIKEKVILPVLSKTIVVKNDIPVSYKIIKGVVPSYYGKSMEKSSDIYSSIVE